jgi:hypothetical protein
MLGLGKRHEQVLEYVSGDEDRDEGEEDENEDGYGV